MALQSSHAGGAFFSESAYLVLDGCSHVGGLYRVVSTSIARVLFVKSGTTMEIAAPNIANTDEVAEEESSGVSAAEQDEQDDMVNAAESDSTESGSDSDGLEEEEEDGESKALPAQYGVP